MQKYFIMLLFAGIFTNNPEKIDFGTTKDGSKWLVINDGVMGGKSAGTIKLVSDKLIFSGTISLENNGGFSKIRSENVNYDLSDKEWMIIRLKGDGRKYSVTFDTSVLFFRPSYWHDVQTSKDEWTDVKIRINDFYETVMGSANGKSIKEKHLKKVKRIGFILYDKNAGDFNLEIDKFYFK